MSDFDKIIFVTLGTLTIIFGLLITLLQILP